MPTNPDLISEANNILDRAIEEHKPTHIFAMFSGGHDSIVATEIASRHPQFSGVVHVNTGIGIEDTRIFVRSLCNERRWNLLEYYPPDRQYEDLVLEFGFPGPGAHSKMYSWLKERPIAQLVREHKRKRFDRIMLVTGVRRQESIRRMGHVKDIFRQGARLWVAPLVSWTALDCRDYMAEVELPLNPVVDLLHMSGECLCGAYAKEGELEEISLYFPGVGQYIKDLEKRVMSNGFPWGWGSGGPPRWYREIQYGQMVLPGYRPLCHGCGKSK